MRIGIVGAGIGGLCAAVGLQASGHAVTVCERRLTSASSGTGLTLFTNSLTALDSLGIGEQVRAISTASRPKTSSIRIPDGRYLVSMNTATTPRLAALHRADLHQLLAQALLPGTIRHGVTAEVDTEGRPTLTVDSDQETFDLVIAADGIHSNARCRWQLDHGLRHAGYSALRAVTHLKRSAVDHLSETLGRGARFGIIPLTGDRVYWYATVSTGITAGHDGFLDQFRNWHDPIPAILSNTDPETVLHHEIHDLTALPRTFMRGRGVLLGDAAHAMTPDIGQGAGQAIEDAATLTALLHRLPDPTDPLFPAALDQALRHYSECRRPRVRHIWKQSRRTGFINQSANPVTARLRNAAYAVAPSKVVQKTINGLTRWELPATESLARNGRKPSGR
ncbi:FAD-dependent monooxygenase [Corynebacterium sp. CCM 9185]|uniref:FAD-dependent monooxygenase n=1 Tax=Corynebacterium marambiense TaxID=2765364 RepID=A0ABS0W198_9CORY|nr:FAD-dependent monooxygenase [Corynebacterium marambiense]MCK7664047.1 FAD-dependent monooxygenase [Corynebacterium marambiense]